MVMRACTWRGAAGTYLDEERGALCIGQGSARADNADADAADEVAEASGETATKESKA